MAWIDSYRQASFRGVEFFVEAHDAEFGRRQVTHEFPQRDTPFTEDLGRKARTYTVEAYLVGDDYPAQRDQLIGACETGDIGELVHPYLGNLQVVCTGLRLRETNTELRMCRVQMSFVEAGEALFPGNLADPLRAVATAGAGVASAAGTGFLSRFGTTGFPSFVGEAAAGRLSGFSSFLQGLPLSVGTNAQGVASFFTQVRELADNAVSLVTEPARVLSEVTGIIGSVRSVFSTGAGGALAAIRAAYVRPSGGLTTTPSRRQDNANDEALCALIRRTCLIEEARFAVAQAQPAEPGADAVTFATREDAIATRDTITGAIDVELEDPTTTSEEYVALAQLRAQVVTNIPSDELRLPRIATVTPPATVPSLVLAYDLYEDAGRSVEIAERNRIPHPGFIPGREPVQVVTDG